MAQYIFFLGGHDLEMLTIKKILDDKKQKYFDNGLSWGAKASSYKQEIENLRPDEIPVFIELEIDISIPSNSIIIDHHNERAGKVAKTSIEQIADLLEINLNQEQQLISANDRAHIQGMIEMGASEEEIMQIRRRDREAQGVTNEDERFALLSIEHFSHRVSKDLIIVYSLTNKTSPIIDRLYKYYRHIFIISLTGELNYSGTGQIIELLYDKFKKYKENDPNVIYWKGGNLPDSGFFGSNNISGKKLLMKKEDIIEFMKPFTKEEYVYSQHIFMFPFTIERKQEGSKSELSGLQGKSNNNDQDSDSDNILKLVNKKLKNSVWKYKPHRILLDIPDDIRKQLKQLEDDNASPYSDEELWAYNEHSYFYEFIHDSLFTSCSAKEIDKNGNIVSLYYEIDTTPDDEITFIIKGDTPNTYTLKLDNVSLRIFETEVGILSFTLYNTCYQNFEDIQKMNDFGRRIYPQFLGTGGVKEPIDITKDNFLCDKIIFKAGNLHIEEEFKTEDFINVLKGNKDTARIKYANYIEELLSPLNNEELTYKSVIDDRMYTLCWYGNDELINNLKKFENGEYVYENNESWYRFIFIDGKSAMVQNYKMKKELIAKSTYGRFADWGTLFGISRYSFVCLTTKSDFAYNIIRNHMQKIYYQFLVLLLAQRASIINFSNKLEKINIVPKEMSEAEEDFKYIEGKLKKLEVMDYKILNFINRMTYKEVTPQEQGIELYALALNNMQINEQLATLRQKIADLHLTADKVLERIHLAQERNRNENQRKTREFFNKITLIGLIFAPLTLYQSMSKFIKPYIKPPSFFEGSFIISYYSQLWSLLFLTFLSVLSYCLINDDYNNKKRYGEKLWFYPLKALFQQFFDFKSETKLKRWKKLLDTLAVILLILSYEKIIELVKYIYLIGKGLWQLFM